MPFFNITIICLVYTTINVWFNIIMFLGGDKLKNVVKQILTKKCDAFQKSSCVKVHWVCLFPF